MKVGKKEGRQEARKEGMGKTGEEGWYVWMTTKGK